MHGRWLIAELKILMERTASLSRSKESEVLRVTLLTCKY